MNPFIVTKINFFTFLGAKRKEGKETEKKSPKK